MLRRAARLAVRQTTDERLAPWREDIEAECVAQVLLMHKRGFRCGLRAWRWAALSARREVLGDSRFKSNWDAVELSGTVPEPEPDLGNGLAPLMAIARSRLQAAWPTLTETQREGLRCKLTGASQADAERALGVAPGSLSVATARALQRIDDPGSFTRIASSSSLSASDKRARANATAAKSRTRDARLSVEARR